MTRLLDKALSQVEKLPASEQRWTESLAKSQDLLARLADKALAEHAAGRTKPL